LPQIVVFVAQRGHGLPQPRRSGPFRAAWPRTTQPSRPGDRGRSRPGATQSITRTSDKQYLRSSCTSLDIEAARMASRSRRPTGMAMRAAPRGSASAHTETASGYELVDALASPGLRPAAAWSERARHPDRPCEERPTGLKREPTATIRVAHFGVCHLQRNVLTGDYRGRARTAGKPTRSASPGAWPPG